MEELLSRAATMLTREPAGLTALPGKPSLQRSLNAIRTHLDMDVAFISEFVDGRRYFRHVDERGSNSIVQPGCSDPAEESYCLRVVDGRLPELMMDARLNVEALKLAATRALPVGAHLSVPIRLADGRIYGTFCCFSRSPDNSLTHRDLAMMRVFAQLAAEQIEEELAVHRSRHVIEDRIDTVLASDGPAMVYQPIIDVAQERIVGFESLAC